MAENNRHSPPLYNTALGCLLDDIELVFALLLFLPGLFFPLRVFRSAKSDELSYSSVNLRVIFLHFLYTFIQIALLISLPFCVFPIVYLATFLWINKALCMLTLNGQARFITSNVDISRFPRHDKEHWIFINGIGVGYVIAVMCP